jgi:formylglycine-generating enzyme required for sulfatase activity/energy-coupling factor transporter ATP-binding protein EcfA2
MDTKGDQGKSNIQASDNSIAFGELNIGGNVGNLHIGHTIGFTADQVSALITQISTTFQPKPFDGRCPYKGLDVFEEEDAELFFGREKLVDDLVSRVKESRTIFITGPSGSGKSSLVRAGLIHALKKGAVKDAYSERWLYASLNPGRDPIEALASAFSRLKNPDLGSYFREYAGQVSALHECAESALTERKDQRLVLFIDQFEEVFTQLSRDKVETFIKLLAHTTAVEHGRVISLFSMRSDFVSNCATYPQLNALLNRQFVQIGAMQPEELVSAMAQPALRVGLRIDPELISQIITDMKGEPGALPLMQFALKELFDVGQAKGSLFALTLGDYLKHGGIDQALERHANSSLAKLNGHEQELARSIFSGLIEIGRGTQDTRRTALFDELIPSRAKSEDVEAIVQKLADARLITTDEVAGKDTVTISHEKLIDAWPWLRKLVNENREVIALQNEIASDAKEWEEHQRDESYLYGGTRLVTAQEKLKKLTLNENAQEFLDACLEARDREIRAKRVRSYSTYSFAVIALILISTVSTLGATGQLARLFYRPLPMEWIQIPEGKFLMGSSDAELANALAICPSCKVTNEQPQHLVHLDTYQIGKYEATNKQYYQCVLAGICNRPANTDYQKTEFQSYPVSDITWKDASIFCEWNGGRLPTEAEWEKAARGDVVDAESTRVYPWGKQWDPQKANVDRGENGTAMPIGSYSSLGDSVYGLSDMSGNVWEWVADWYDATYYAGTLDKNPTGPETGSYKILRGGSFENSIINARSTYRAYSDNNSTSTDLGFRCAK